MGTFVELAVSILALPARSACDNIEVGGPSETLP